MTRCTTSQFRSSRAGFSLVELSIVLVVIGLLVGAVVAGQSLIYSARLHNLIEDVTRFQEAVTHFREQYDEYPGDISTANQIWGAADSGDGTGADCRNTISTSKTTCKGDGDGRIETFDASSNEAIRLWQHLVNAGFLTGQYTGAYNASGHLEAGVNVPQAPINNGAYEFYYSATLFGRAGHLIKLGTIRDSSVNNAIFSPNEALALDKKHDDGEADSGEIVALDALDTGGCVTNGTSFSAPSSYISLSNTRGCRLYFRYVD